MPCKIQLCQNNPFNPEFTMVIFIHYKSRIAVAILDMQWMKMTFAVDKDDLMWFKNYRKLPCIGKPVSCKFSF